MIKVFYSFIPSSWLECNPDLQSQPLIMKCPCTREELLKHFPSRTSMANTCKMNVALAFPCAVVALHMSSMMDPPHLVSLQLVLHFHQGPFRPLSKYTFCLTSVYWPQQFSVIIIWNFDGDLKKAWCCLMCKSKSTGSKWRGFRWTCSKDAVSLQCCPPPSEFKALLEYLQLELIQLVPAWDKKMIIFSCWRKHRYLNLSHSQSSFTIPFVYVMCTRVLLLDLCFKWFQC